MCDRNKNLIVPKAIMIFSELVYSRFILLCVLCWIFYQLEFRFYILEFFLETSIKLLASVYY